MAKVAGPLFSLRASGAIAETLVYFAWKGLKVVRSYVVPANPQSTDQTTQRGYLTAAVAKIHACQVLAADALDDDDQSAYARWGSVYPTPRTWFNQAVKQWLDVKVAGDDPIIYCNGTISDKTANSIDLAMDIEEETGSQLAAGKFYFGSTPTNLIHTAVATVTAGDDVALTNEDCSAFLTAGTRYYVQFRPDSGDPSEGSYSGIYTFVAE